MTRTFRSLTRKSFTSFGIGVQATGFWTEGLQPMLGSAVARGERRGRRRREREGSMVRVDGRSRWVVIVWRRGWHLGREFKVDHGRWVGEM